MTQPTSLRCAWKRWTRTSTTQRPHALVAMLWTRQLDDATAPAAVGVVDTLHIRGMPKHDASGAHAGDAAE